MQDRKKNVTLRIDTDLLDWVDEKIKEMRFASKSQAVSFALNELKADDSRYFHDFSLPVPMENLNGWFPEKITEDRRHIHKRDIGNVSLTIDADETERELIGSIIYGDHKNRVSRRPLTRKWVHQYNIDLEKEIPQSIKTKRDLATYLEDHAKKIQFFE